MQFLQFEVYKTRQKILQNSSKPFITSNSIQYTEQNYIEQC